MYNGSIYEEEMLRVYPSGPMVGIALKNACVRQAAYYMLGFPVERIISIAANP